MSSPRKRRNDDDTHRTPTKVRKEEKPKEEVSFSSAMQTMYMAFRNDSFDWAEASMNSSTAAVEISQEITSETTTTPDKENLTECNVSNRTRSRKNTTPKRNPGAGKARFERVLDMGSALSSVRSERVLKLEEEKRRVELNLKSRSADRNARPERKRQRTASQMSLATDDGQITPRRSNATTPRRSANSTPRSNRKMPRLTETPERVGGRPVVRTLNFDDTMSPKPKDDYVDPKVGWCTDEATLRRRGKEIEKAKEKDVYKRYLAEVPIMCRQKGVHPRTPNKYLDYSRRNWDNQVRKWKRDLYTLAGEDCPSSLNTSRAPSVCETPEEVDSPQTQESISAMLEAPDAMASLFGHFDMNTRQATLMCSDESTLKATENRGTNAPIDFSKLNA